MPEPNKPEDQKPVSPVQVSPNKQPPVVNAKAEKYFKEMKDCYEKLFASPIGQKVLGDIKKSGLSGRTSFNTDSLRMAFGEGQRSLALHISNMATPTPIEVKDKDAIK